MSQLTPTDLAAPDLPISPAPSLPIISMPAPEPDTRRDPADLRSTAFDAAPFQLHGANLRPLALGTEAFFFEHRRAIGAPPFTLFPDDVRAIMADASRLLYLLSHDPAHWLRARAAAYHTSLENHLTLEQQMMDWAATHLQRDPDAMLAYTDLLQSIFARVRQSRIMPAETGGSPGGSLGK